MGNHDTRRTLHARFCSFVDWIKPEKETIEAIQTQAADIRERICAKAVADGLTIRSTPNSGSFAKRTGLRRHLRGSVPVEGQDVDLAFVVSPKNKDDEEITSLINRFYSYAHDIYPRTSKNYTKSSVRLEFVSTNLCYDLVPMLATKDPERQILLRTNGERRETSVQMHIDFIKKRTARSREIDGRVEFNECIRLTKWWRSVRCNGDEDAVPSIIIDLLCAAAFDARSVQATYTETLADWFGWLHHVAKTRQTVYFAEYLQARPATNGVVWVVADPVNSENNVVAAWGGLRVDELAEWLATSRDHFHRAIARDQRDDDVGSLAALVEIFGTAFRDHCGDDE
jgi:tRNA nucleotidyltransferase (CCA-adding enzyme)